MSMTTIERILFISLFFFFLINLFPWEKVIEKDEEKIKINVKGQRRTLTLSM